MNKKRICIILLFFVIISSIVIILFNSKRDIKGFYSLKDDNIKTITSVVGDRKLIKKNCKTENDTITKRYEYKEIDDVYSDLSIYISYLKNESKFLISKNYDLNKKNGDIELTRYSVDKKYIIILKIKYTKDTYTIEITRGKGKIKVS